MDAHPRSHSPGWHAVVKLGLKLALVLILGLYMTQRGLVSASATGQAFGHAGLLLAALAALLVQNGICALRWRMLVAVHGIRLSVGRTAELTLIGLFFNVALPGAVSGDFVKGYLVAREPGVRDGARIFGSIVFDRITGVSALVMVAAGSILFADGSVFGASYWQAIRLGVIGATAGVVTFFTYLLLVGVNRDPLLRLLKAIERRIPKAAIATGAYEGTRAYSAHPVVVLIALAASLVVHLLNAAAFILIARALEEPIGVLPGMVVVPLGMLVTALPVLPMGIGTGHAAFGFLFLALGSRRGADAFNLNLFYYLLLGAAGALVYLRFRSRGEAAPPLHPPGDTGDLAT